MAVAAGLAHDVGVEAVLHRVEYGGAHAAGRRVAAAHQRVAAKGSQYTGQAGPKEATAVLLDDDNLVGAGCAALGEVAERVALVVRVQNLGQLVFVPVAAVVSVLGAVADGRIDDRDAESTAGLDGAHNGLTRLFETDGRVQWASRVEVAGNGVDDEKDGLFAEGKLILAVAVTVVFWARVNSALTEKLALEFLTGQVLVAGHCVVCYRQIYVALW